MLPSLSTEFRLSVGVERSSDPLSFLATRADALWIDVWDEGGPSRLCSALSWFFLDLKRNAMAQRLVPRDGRSLRCGGCL